MKYPAWDRLSDFLDVEDFAVIAVRNNGTAFPLLLEEQYLSHELGTYDVAAATPWATAKLCDVQDLKKRSRLKIDDDFFWLTHDPEPDGTGMAILHLSRSEPS